MAFLDTRPIRPGHVQLIPREHHAAFDDMPAALAAHLMLVGQRMARALKRVSGVERVAFLFTGGDVAHAHAHLVPMHDRTDITSRRYILEEPLTFRPMPAGTAAELGDMAGRLRSAFHGTDAPP